MLDGSRGMAASHFADQQAQRRAGHPLETKSASIAPYHDYNTRQGVATDKYFEINVHLSATTF